MKYQFLFMIQFMMILTLCTMRIEAQEQTDLIDKIIIDSSQFLCSQSVFRGCFQNLSLDKCQEAVSNNRSVCRQDFLNDYNDIKVILGDDPSTKIDEAKLEANKSVSCLINVLAAESDSDPVLVQACLK